MSEYLIKNYTRKDLLSFGAKFIKYVNEEHKKAVDKNNTKWMKWFPRRISYHDSAFKLTGGATRWCIIFSGRLPWATEEENAMAKNIVIKFPGSECRLDCQAEYMHYLYIKEHYPQYLNLFAETYTTTIEIDGELLTVEFQENVCRDGRSASKNSDEMNHLLYEVSSGEVGFPEAYDPAKSYFINDYYDDDSSEYDEAVSSGKNIYRYRDYDEDDWEDQLNSALCLHYDNEAIADDILYMLSKIDADDIHMGNFVITKDELKIFDFAGYSGNYDASKDDEMEDSNEQ